jgi:hypothetical protein
MASDTSSNTFIIVSMSQLGLKEHLFIIVNPQDKLMENRSFSLHHLRCLDPSSTRNKRVSKGQLGLEEHTVLISSLPFLAR